jgi:hypothetical protein
VRDAYLQLIHEQASRDHNTKARARALRAAATAIASRTTVSPIEREVFDKIIDRLRADAAELESTLPVWPGVV